MILPDGWSTRPPTIDDVPALLKVTHASDIAAVGYPDFPEYEVREVLEAPHTDLARDQLVAVDPDGTVVGWAYLDNPNQATREFVEVYVHPELGVPARAVLLSRQLARVAEKAAELGLDRMTVRAGAVPTETGWAGDLRAAGFGFVKRYARMSRPLDGVSTTPPAPPAGVEVRVVDPSSDDDMRTFHRVLDTAFRDTPDYDPMTYEHWRERIAALSSVAYDEWFVATVDGAVAGILQSSDQGVEDDEGWVRYLAVLRGHRKRGIGAALLGHAFAGYAAKGRKRAGLGVDLSNPTEAARLYRAAGMTASYEADIFERSVEATAG
ncbi:GNAT family N-acetyltransferase [Polymorphospora sp. NPDC050346]|uniref:GNAT family N-acetyltransferase n=1 Tax=Polymorphospora sp. NPDC050346 TaxID=3155780 RepID=UPI0033C39E6A